LTPPIGVEVADPSLLNCHSGGMAFPTARLFFGVGKRFLLLSGDEKKEGILSKNLKRLIEIGNMFALLS